MASRKAKVFEGHKCTTGIHNALLDVVMPEISSNAWKVLCFVIRQTDGWNRDEAGIGYTDLMKGTGIKSRATIAAVLEELTTYRYQLLTIIPGTQHSESTYAVNRDAEIDWQPRDFTQSSSSKIEPLRDSSSSKIELLSSSKNELLKPSSSSKIELSYRKESNILKQEGENPAEIFLLLAEKYSFLIEDLRDEQKLKFDADKLRGSGATVAQVREWLDTRTTLSSIGYISKDFKKWLASQPSAAPTTHSSGKTYCGNCNHGWLAPNKAKGETSAMPCGCQYKKQEVAA